MGFAGAWEPGNGFPSNIPGARFVIYLSVVVRRFSTPKQLNIDFQALIISRIQYATSACDACVHTEWWHKTDVFLSREFLSGLCCNATFDSLLYAADQPYSSPSVIVLIEYMQLYQQLETRVVTTRVQNMAV